MEKTHVQYWARNDANLPTLERDIRLISFARNNNSL